MCLLLELRLFCQSVIFDPIPIPHSILAGFYCFGGLPVEIAF